MSQLKELAKPFHAKLIEQKPGRGGGSYVNHASVTERALATVGPFSSKVEQLIFNAEGKVDGALVTLTVDIDGRTVSITEAGEGDNPTAKTNGALAKDAISDALKRCWMRTGLGLHLWSQEHYVLDKVLARNEAPEQAVAAEPPPKPQQERVKAEKPKEVAALPDGAIESALNEPREDWLRGQLIHWGFDQTDAKGQPIFSAAKQAANSYDKLTREYVASLEPKYRPGPNASDDEKDLHRKAVNQHWIKKVRAYQAGEDYALPPYEEGDKKRVAEPFKADEGKAFESLGA